MPSLDVVFLPCRTKFRNQVRQTRGRSTARALIRRGPFFRPDWYGHRRLDQTCELSSQAVISVVLHNSGTAVIQVDFHVMARAITIVPLFSSQMTCITSAKIPHSHVMVA